MIQSPAAFYQGRVVHTRSRPKRHRLSYRTFSMLLDLDRLDELAKLTRLFGHNRPALLSFRDRDHGGGRDDGPRGFADRLLAEAGFAPAAHVHLLCNPRLLGYVFNPLSVYFCYDAEGALMATIHEVHNTFGDRHAYVLDAGQCTGALIRQHTDKTFLVSPFLPIQGHYDFTIRPPGTEIAIVIKHADADGPILNAAFTGTFRPFTRGEILRLVFTHPLMSYRIIAGIHWEALKLWAKGVPFLGRQGTKHCGGIVDRAQAGPAAGVIDE